MMHPDLQTIIRFHEDALAPRARAVIVSHLNSCQPCRLMCDGLANDSKADEPDDAAPDEMMAAILGSIKQWNSRQSSGCSGPGLKSRVAKEIAPYLGERAANQLLATVSDTGHDLLSTIEPLLGEFLGPKAAADLVTRLVDRAIVC